MAIINIKLDLDADGFRSAASAAGADVDQLTARVNARFESASARLTTFAFGLNNLAEIAGRLTQALAAPIEKLIEADEVSRAASETFKGKLDVAITDLAAKVRPLVVGFFDFATALLEMNWQPFVIGATAAGGAVAAIGIASLISSFGGLVPAIGAASAAVVGFATTATAAISSIPIVGWVAAGIGALAGLTAALIAAQEDESDLAAERKRTAEQTLAIIEAEKKRVEQAVLTDGATSESTRRLRLLNEELIRQQKIISDANLKILEDKLKEAQEEFRDLAEEAQRTTAIMGQFWDQSTEAELLRNLLDRFGEDVVAINSEIESRMAEIGDRLFEHRTGILKLSEDQINGLEKERQGYSEISKVIGAAAQAQAAYNEELENRRRLSEPASSAASAPAAIPAAIPAAVVTPAPAVVAAQVAEMERVIPPLRLDVQMPGASARLELFQQDAERIFADADEMLQLRFKNNLMSESQYYEARWTLLSEFVQRQIGMYGEESRQALAANEEKIRFEEEYAAKRAQLQAQQVSSFVATGAQLMASAQGVSQNLFGVGKAFAIAQGMADTYAAANKALAAYPPPFSFIAAAAAIAAGLTNVAKISATNFERRREGGIVGSDSRMVLGGDFGGGEDRLIIANSGEFIVNADATQRNLELLQLINAGHSAVRFQAGGLVGAQPGAGAPSPTVVFDGAEIVQAIRDIKIEVRSELDSLQFFRKNYPVYEREEELRRVS